MRGFKKTCFFEYGEKKLCKNMISQGCSRLTNVQGKCTGLLKGWFYKISILTALTAECTALLSRCVHHITTGTFSSPV